MLNCVKHIEERGLESLHTDFGIDIKDYGEFVVLNYDQIESPKFNPIVDECRGLILAKNTWQVLCRSFDRFYNFGEDPHTHHFRIEKATVTEKIDGSLIRFWWNPFRNIWCVATRKMAFAEGPVTNGTCTFADIIARVVANPNKFFEDDVELRRNTIICELVSPETRVVKPYGETAIYYLGMRNNDTGQYIDVPDETPYRRFDFGWYFAGFKKPRVYTFGTFIECLEAANALPTFDEGYVTCWNDWRIKVKSPAYLALAHLRNNGALSLSRMLYLICTGEDAEYLSYFPEDAPVIQPWVDAYARLRDEAETVYFIHKDIFDQKEFALTVKDKPYAGMLFTMRKSGKTFSRVIADIVERAEKGKVPDSLVDLVSKFLVA